MTTPLSSGDARDLDELIDEIVSNSKDVEMYSTVEYDLSMRQRAIEEVQRLRGEIHGKFTTLRAERSEQGKDREDGERLDWLEAWTKGDQTICPPGNHGGALTNWLMHREDESRSDRQGIWAEEHEGATLRAALDAARATPPETGANG